MSRLVSSFARPVGNWVLGASAVQRQGAAHALTAAAACAACLLLLYAGMRLGLADDAAWGRAAPWLALPAALAPATIYGLVRSGWSLRLADPSMTLAQLGCAAAALLTAYGLFPPVRSALLLLLALVMAFGMFTLTPAAARRMTLATLVAFGAAMAALAWRRPAVFDPRMEAIHFAVLCVVLPAVASLAGHTTRLRLRQSGQRRALNGARTRLEQMKRHDDLTGLLNRRAMLERLAEEQRRRDMDPSPSCICLLDLDHFKRINDLHGHAGGDEVLRRFARQATASIRRVDVLARWGGEEFLLFLPGTHATQACHAIDRLRASLANPAAWQDRPELQVTLSAGVALWRRGETALQVTERAEAQAHRAKAAGRDRWACEPSPRAVPT